MVSIQQQFLQAARISQYFFWNAGQRTMSFVDELDLPIAAFKYWNALEHFHYDSNESIDTLLFCAIPAVSDHKALSQHPHKTALYFGRFNIFFP